LIKYTKDFSVFLFPGKKVKVMGLLLSLFCIVFYGIDLYFFCPNGWIFISFHRIFSDCVGMNDFINASKRIGQLQ